MKASILTFISIYLQGNKKTDSLTISYNSFIENHKQNHRLQRILETPSFYVTIIQLQTYNFSKGWIIKQARIFYFVF